MIYICIPTHNEQQTVGVVLWKLRQVLTEFHRDYQLLVADDASTDKTPEVLEPYTRVLPLTVIRSERRLGHGASLEMLLREAVRRSEYPKRDVIVTLQADFSEEPDDVVPMIKRIEAGADLVVGNKVSVTRPPRRRRIARALGTFFTRAQQWPEGVTTPFDGYRAYRLYGIKRAFEDRTGRRVVRYDGWAGNAELLRAVLPHARRVEVLDVEDRPDRLQRPRRERPFAAALRVRPMMNDVEPQGLVSVEELDRLASTASRSRDGAARLRQGDEPPPAAPSERGNGRSRQRGGGGRPRNGGERGPTRNDNRAAPIRAQATAQTAVERPARGRHDRPAQHRHKGEKPHTERPRPPDAPPPPPADAAPGAAAEAVLDPAADLTAAIGQDAPLTRSKKRRRRRRRSAAARLDGAQAVGPEDSVPGELAAPAGSADGEEGVGGSERGDAGPGSSEVREPKRRRRRGGRSRRRGARAAGGEGSVVAEAAAPDPASPPGDAAAAEPAPAPAPPAVRNEE